MPIYQPRTFDNTNKLTFQRVLGQTHRQTLKLAKTG